MNPEPDALTALDTADREYTERQMATNAAKDRLFEACAAAVSAGYSPDSIADRLRNNKTPEQIKAGLTFTAAYIRRRVRDLGVGPLRSGPKKR